MQGFEFLRDITSRRLWQAIGLLAGGLVITLYISLNIKSEIEAAARNEFASACNEIQLNIADRLESTALTLYSGSAFFAASTEVTREDWRIFTEKLRIEQQMPGIQGIGYTVVIPSDQLEAHIARVRGEGFAEYTVQPEGDREVYTSIIYIEPFSGRNLRAFGYDMFSEAVRRAAMERARDTNHAALSGKVILVQETDEDVQAGALMYAPVYRNGAQTDTIEQRRAALLGWIYIPYRMDNLMRGTLGSYSVDLADRQIWLLIYDGEEITPDALLYDSHSDDAAKITPSTEDVTIVTQANYFGQTWTLKFTHLGGVTSFADYGSFWLVLLGGSSISLLLFGLTISLMRAGYYLESIRRLAEMDSLTGVYNRRKILDLAQEEYTRAKRQRHPLTILVLDLDFFKRINDTYGHATGDQALHLTASAIQAALRQDIDRVGRIGGDEFMILLPEIQLGQVEQITARVRASVAENTQNIANGLRPVSFSVGAAELSEETNSLDELIEIADHAMYAEKRLAKE